MKFINEKTALINGNLFTNMPFEPELLTGQGITIHVKRDVWMSVLERPSRLKPGDYYLNYEEFLKKFPMGIKDIIGFSRI